MGDLTSVTIDFEQSHLIFPKLVAVILAVLAITILIRERQRIATVGAYWSSIIASMDKRRYFGTLALTLIYFFAMIPVGDIWPNTGRGFLFCSIPFVFLASLLFMHERTPRRIVPVAIVSVVAPVLVWWLFAHVFTLTLP